MKVLRPFVFHVSALVLGTVWFSVLVTLWSLGLGLLVTLLGLPVIWLTLVAARECAAVEASLARSLLDADVEAPPRQPGWQLLDRLRDGRLWAAQVYLLLRFALGLAFGTVLISLWGTALGLTVAPVYYWAIPDGIELGLFHVDDLGTAFAVIPAGIALGALSVPITVWSGTLWRRLAERLLPVGAPGPGGMRVPRIAPALRITLLFALGVQTLCLVLWALTGRTSAWPAWTAIGLAAPVGLQLAVRARTLAPTARTRPLAITAALGAVCTLLCVAIWVVAGHGYFWPVWVILGWAVVLGLHALVELGARSERTALAPRMEQLTRTRAGVVDARDEELRRIERDLHDGAQARLVAMAMNLGLAEERLDRDPDGARELMVEARLQAGTAIKELRDLARGIAPPVLSDRGLKAAIEALGMTSPMLVTVTGSVGPRPTAAIERAGYFVAAEALANAAKHSGADRVRVTLHRTEDALVVEIADDGRGGARPTGPGLAGLRQRVEAVDGRLEVESAAGAGTIIRAWLPCASS